MLLPCCKKGSDVRKVNDSDMPYINYVWGSTYLAPHGIQACMLIAGLLKMSSMCTE